MKRNLKMNFKKLGYSGQSLVSVLVAGGIGAIVIGFFTDMMVQQGTNQKFLAQKMETGDLTANIISTFSRASNCNCQFADNATTNPNHGNYANLKFNSTITNGSQVIDVKKIYAGCISGGTTPPLIAEEGAILPNSMTQSLRVDKVELVNLRPTGGAPDEWQGQWRISFQTGPGSAIRSIRPVMLTQKLVVNPLPDPLNARIQSCVGLSTGTGTTNFLAKWSPITGVLQDTGAFEDAAGKIGIGTITPQAFMHIKKNDPDLLRLDRPTTVGGGPALDFYDSTTPFGALGQIVTLQNAAGENGANMAFYTKTHDAAGLGASKMILTHNGRLGLGVPSPTAPFEMKYSPLANWDMVHIVGGHSMSMYSSSSLGSAYEGRVNLSRSRGTAAAKEDVDLNDLLGGIWFNGHPANTTVNQHTAGIYVTATQDFDANSFGGKMTFATASNAEPSFTTDRMVIDQNGSVGIGTSTPLSKLHIEGNIRTNHTTGWSGMDMFLNGANRSTVYNDINYPGSVAFDTPGGSQPQKMIIRNGGNVGIGTQNPGFPLVVRNALGGINTAAASFETTAVNAGFIMRDSGTTIPVGIFSAGNDIVFYANNVERMRIMQSGDVWANGNCMGGPCISDRRLKKNISDYTLGLNELLSLQPKNFSFNGRGQTPNDGKMTVGLIAQDVQKSVPNLVKTMIRKPEADSAAPAEFLGVNYSELIYIVINSIKEIFHRNEETTSKLELVEKRLQELETKYRHLEKSCSREK